MSYGRQDADLESHLVFYQEKQKKMGFLIFTRLPNSASELVRNDNEESV